MSKRHFVAFAAICGFGCFLGSSVGSPLAWSRIAAAQVQPQILQPKIQDIKIVPGDGYRFVNERGKMVMMISDNGGNGALTLFNADGRPSVYLSAGRNGHASLIARDGGGALAFGRESDSANSELSMNAEGGSLVLEGAKGVRQLDLATNAQGSSLVLRDRDGKPSLQLGAGGAPEVKLIDGRGRAAMQLTMVKDVAEASFTDQEGKPAITISGSRRLRIIDGKEVLWQAPPKPGS